MTNPTREQLIALLEQNDPNGVYSDEDIKLEGAFGRPWTDAELLQEAHAQGLVLVLPHYHVGHRQPGNDPEGEVREFVSREAALAQNQVNAEEALAGLDGPEEGWTLQGPDEDGDYFVTLVRDGADVFSWHHFIEECNDARDHLRLGGEEPSEDAIEVLA